MLDKPILHGNTITLRPICADDAAAMFASLSDQETNRLTGTHKSFTLGQIVSFYGRVAEADDRADYAIVLTDHPTRALGEVVLNDISWHNRSANFRIALFDNAFFGQGYGTQATQIILAYGFTHLDLHRIDLEVYDFNPRAARVYEKAGFVREGVKRGALRWNGTYHDAIVMSILRHEYVQRARNEHNAAR